METIKLKVVYEPYTRYDTPCPKAGRITAPTFREAIIKMLSKVNMYLEEDDIYAQEAELGRHLTQKEILDQLIEQNGDGCDFIFHLSNEETGETYIKDPYDPFEEWEL